MRIKQMKLKIFVEYTNRPPGPNSEFVQVPNGNETLVPNIGDSVQLGGMSDPEVVKARRYKFIGPNTLSDTDTLEVHLEV
jgi:hypothetical protein